MKRQNTITIKLEITEFLHRYLEYLAARSVLGVNVEDVATYMLIEAADRRFRDGFHEKRVPRWDD